MKKYILASKSPRRKLLLEWAELEFEVLVSETDESYPMEMTPGQVPVHIARNKALAVQAAMAGSGGKENRVIIAADTIVVLENEIIGKPGDRDDAVGILSKLSGKEHQVITGVVLMQGSMEISFSDTTDVWFHELTREQIVFYVDKYKPFDKAGAYAIQEWIGVIGIQKIEGDFYNVMGLPVSKVVRALKEFDSN